MILFFVNRHLFRISQYVSMRDIQVGTSEPVCQFCSPHVHLSLCSRCGHPPPCLGMGQHCSSGFLFWKPASDIFSPNNKPGCMGVKRLYEFSRHLLSPHCWSQQSLMEWALELSHILRQQTLYILMPLFFCPCSDT